MSGSSLPFSLSLARTRVIIAIFICRDEDKNKIKLNYRGQSFCACQLIPVLTAHLRLSAYLNFAYISSGMHKSSHLAD